MRDSRLNHINALLDDARTELADIEEEGPPLMERAHLQAAHDAINTAIRRVQNAADWCDVCGGAHKVMRAERTGGGFNWAIGDLIPCPACVIGVG